MDKYKEEMKLITNYTENNHLVLIGKVASEKKFSHEIYGERFYIFNLDVPRLSDISDIIPITVSERLIMETDLSIGNKILVEGQFRSYNGYENEKSKLILTVFAKEITPREEIIEDGVVKKEANSNEVVLQGYICKKPIYRQTPFGREISDYIPCIAWGRNARFCQNVEVGTRIKITGRVQSRTYEKKFEDGTSEQRVAYEVSIISLEVINEEGNAVKEEQTENQEAI